MPLMVHLVAHENVSIAGGTLQEQTIRDCKARGESKGFKCTAKSLRQGQAQHGGHLNNVGDGAPLKMTVEGKSEY